MYSHWKQGNWWEHFHWEIIRKNIKGIIIQFWCFNLMNQKKSRNTSVVIVTCSCYVLFMPLTFSIHLKTSYWIHDLSFSSWQNFSFLFLFSELYCSILFYRSQKSSIHARIQNTSHFNHIISLIFYVYQIFFFSQFHFSFLFQNKCIGSVKSWNSPTSMGMEVVHAQKDR